MEKTFPFDEKTLSRGIWYSLNSWPFLAGIVEYGLGEYSIKHLNDLSTLMDCSKYRFDKHNNKELVEILSKELANSIEGNKKF